MTFEGRVWRVRRTVEVEVVAHSAMLAIEAARDVDEDRWDAVQVEAVLMGPDSSSPATGGRDDDYTDEAVDRDLDDAADEELDPEAVRAVAAEEDG